MPAALEASRRQLVDSYERLPPDPHLIGDRPFRRRRFVFFDFHSGRGTLRPFPPEIPYVQPERLNSYAGGVARRFSPMRPGVRDGGFLQALLRMDFDLLPPEGIDPSARYLVDVHAVRITAHPGAPSSPTPEGPHRDGDCFVFAHLIDRRGARGGCSEIYSDDGERLAQKTLSMHLDTLIVWDRYLLHHVTPLCAESASGVGTRDVLLVGFTHVARASEVHAGLAEWLLEHDDG